MLLGVGTGWMPAEFRAVGVEHSQRGTITDTTLEFFNRCFASDEVELNGQRFLFLPCPTRPPIFVGGAAPHALKRTARFGDGWMPMGADPEGLHAPNAQLRKEAASAGKPVPEVALLTTLPLDDPPRAAERARAFAEVGVTRLIHAWRYAEATAFVTAADRLAKYVRPALT